MTPPANVNVQPLPERYRALAARLRPMHPPLFEGEPTRADIELAIALLLVLDPESLAWYGGDSTVARLRARLDA